MKRTLITTALTAAIVLVACTAQKKTEYDFPDAMLPHVQAENYKRCEQGRVLYAMNCGKCHNTKVKGKEVVPDFKPEQLTGYTLRVSNAKHESAMPDTLVSEEELVIIMTFLNYKKKSNVPAFAGK